jgi:hypothetical protein
MDLINNVLANTDIQTLLISAFGLLLTFIINRAAGVFTAATGIAVQARHREALHEAIKSGVESAILHGPQVAFEIVKAQVIQHLRESVPDALKALTPGDGVIDRLIERYTLQALNKVRSPK